MENLGDGSVKMLIERTECSSERIIWIRSQDSVAKSKRMSHRQSDDTLEREKGELTGGGS